MSEIQIELTTNLETGKVDLVISYDSDDDALPIEHEAAHRAILERLLAQGVLSAGQVGELVIRRGRPELARPQAAPQRSEDAERGESA